MKQGTGNRIVGDRKVEPNSRGVNPGGADRIGVPSGNHTNEGMFTPKPTQLYNGKGFEAPPIRNTTSRKGGSQGSY